MKTMVDLTKWARELPDVNEEIMRLLSEAQRACPEEPEEKLWKDGMELSKRYYSCRSLVSDLGYVVEEPNVNINTFIRLGCEGVESSGYGSNTVYVNGCAYWGRTLIVHRIESEQLLLPCRFDPSSNHTRVETIGGKMAGIYHDGMSVRFDVGTKDPNHYASLPTRRRLPYVAAPCKFKYACVENPLAETAGEHWDNIQAMLTDAIYVSRKLTRAQERYGYWHDGLKTIQKSLESYCEFFGVSVPTLLPEDRQKAVSAKLVRHKLNP